MDGEIIVRAKRINPQVIVDAVKEIVDKYDTALTLRQIHYLLVTQEVYENTDNRYKRLSEILVDARLEGEIPLDAIEDRTRHVYDVIVSGSDTLPSNVNIIESFYGHRVEEPYDYLRGWLRAFKDCDTRYIIPRWTNQPYYVEVWLEKRALQAIFNEVTDDLRVPLLPTGGYASLTYIYEAAERLKIIRRLNPYIEEMKVLYAGDHDMRGLHIQEICDSRLNGNFGVGVEVERIALTEEQIREHDLIPQPAKKTDSMARGWIEEHGDVAWELDALEPNLLGEIIRTAIDEYFDEDIYNEVEEEQEEKRKDIKRNVERFLKKR